MLTPPLVPSRWQAAEPGARAFADMLEPLHGDPEAEVWRILAALCCAPFLRPYLQVCASIMVCITSLGLPLGHN